MFIRKGRRAQTTAEYAILIGVVVAAILAMQAFVRRGIMNKIKEAGTFTTSTTAMGEIATTGWFNSFTANMVGNEALGLLSTGQQSRQQSTETGIMAVGGAYSKTGNLVVNAISNEVIYD